MYGIYAGVDAMNSGTGQTNSIFAFVSAVVFHDNVNATQRVDGRGKNQERKHAN